MRLLALELLFLSASATLSIPQSQCLDDAVSPVKRANITVNGTSMPLGIVSFSWASAYIEVEIYRIIVEEVVGFNTRVAILGASMDGFYLISGCTCGLIKVCFERPVCHPESNEYQVVVGAWRTYIVSAVDDIQANLPWRSPSIVGSIGYESGESVYIREEVIQEAYDQEEMPLEYYRVYNTSVDITQFFDSVQSISPGKLMPCNLTRHTFSVDMEAFARHSGDWDGIESLGNGLYRGKCTEEGWWLAPRCRHNILECIPLITGGNGWSLTSWMAKSATFGIPLAIGTAADFATYSQLPYEHNIMFYWWFPDTTFGRLPAIPMLFPPHNPEEWTDGNQRSTGSAGTIVNMASYWMADRGKESFLEVLRSFGISAQTASRLSARFVELEGQSQGMAHSEIGRVVACEWLRGNEDIWRPWVPLRTKCEAGQGLASDMAVLGSFVSSREAASGCQWCATGRYSKELTDAEGTTRVCEPCPVGMDQTFSGQSSCSPCQPGRFKANTSSELCDRCTPGRATALEGQTACPLCPRGTATARRGELQCLACSNGTAAEEEGQLVCSFCGAGRYAASSGVSACSDCSLVLDGSTSPRGSSSAAECVCPSSTYMTPGHGCLSCPDGLECPGGNSEPLQQAGIWVDLKDSTVRQLRTYGPSTYSCRNEGQCPAGPLGSCAEHRRGTACNNCEDGHYPTEEGGCKPCGSGSSLPFIACVVLLPLLLFCLLLLARSDASRQHLSIITVGCITGQVVTSMQTLSAMHKVQIQFPEPLKGIMELFARLMNFDLLHLPCILTTDTPVTRFAVQLLGYPFLASLLFSWAGILKVLGKSFDAAVLYNINGILMFIAYITMTLNVMLPFQCQQNPGGFLSMVTEPGLKCFEDADHIALTVLAALGIVAYPVSIAAWVAYATWRYKSNIHTSEGVGRLRAYRFLFARFHPECYYFGLVILVRNCLVASIPVLLVRVPGLQVLLLVVVLLVGVVLQASFWPWRTELANRAELALGISMTAVAAGVGILLPGTDPGLSAMLGWILAVLIIVVLLSAVVLLSWVVYRRLRPPKRFGMFLCHHKAGAGVLCRLLKTLLASNAATIFLDSDHLDDLDCLFDIVRSSISSLVVVLSQRVLYRPWCAGEMVTAHRNFITILPLLCEDFDEPELEDLPALVDEWSEEEFATLAAFDISKQMVVDAYMHLLELPRISLSRFDSLEEKRGVMMQVARLCLGTGKPAGPSMSTSLSFGSTASASSDNGKGSAKRPEVLVMGIVSEGERLSACELMQVLLQKRMEVEAHVVRQQEEAEALAVGGYVKVIVVLLSGGLLQNTHFARMLLTLCGPGQGERSPHLLTALSDTEFQFPSTDFYAELEESGLGVPGLGAAEGPRLAATYYSMLSSLAKPFTPLASETLITGQVSQLGSRAAQLLRQSSREPSKRSAWSAKRTRAVRPQGSI